MYLRRNFAREFDCFHRGQQVGRHSEYLASHQKRNYMTELRNHPRFPRHSCLRLVSSLRRQFLGRISEHNLVYVSGGCQRLKLSVGEGTTTSSVRTALLDTSHRLNLPRNQARWPFKLLTMLIQKNILWALNPFLNALLLSVRQCPYK
jgi:hypothetical protein